MRTAILFLLTVGVTLSWVAAAPAPSGLSEALQAQRARVAESPNDAKALNDLGNLEHLAGHRQAAEDSYRRALAIDSSLTSARFNLALLLAQQARRDEAEGELEVLLEAAPDHAWGHFQLGYLHEQRGQEKDAVAAYARAFQLDSRLTFSDINPQVLDSKLVTRALLAARSGHTSAAEAPRTYEDPFYIASLLLPRLPEEEEPAEEEASPALRSGAGSGSSAAVPASEAKTLTAEDLDPDSRVGEADPAVVGGRRSNPGWRGRNQRPPNRTQTVQPTPRQSPIGGGRSGRTSQPDVSSTGRTGRSLRPN